MTDPGNAIEFETPENIAVRYTPAGLGSRFLAWLTDFLILFVVMIVVMITVALMGTGMGRMLDRFFDDFDPENIQQMPLYLIGVLVVVFGLGSFLYFGIFEFIMGGRTPGKRSLKLRVVRADGFSLTPGIILVRNVFRIIDNYPLFWIVPILSPKCQRFGDMVAGTLVIEDTAPQLDRYKETLAEHYPEKAEYRFTSLQLNTVTTADREAAETLLKRWSQLPQRDRETLSATICRKLAERLEMDEPPTVKRRTFLKDFLAAYYAREYSKL